ncbi:MDR family MFS transporter [Lawsonella clevelandensis]|uniref:Multidrug resistance protein 3 n=1 Tax=Lawsonella clevelandensis TaxID=1528099 RepID=A0A5E3ZWF6_9ACTN|nr:MDR family MFS transporter [Lawsonella clevelandensis]VHO00404.1 Multidrug resistance protein 3 [Lawsonella clevelandensis]
MNDKQGKKARRREVLQALAGVMVGMFVAMTSLTIVGTSLPTMIKELHGSQTSYTWVVTASMLSSTIATIIAGKLADQFHKKHLLMAGFVIFAIGSLLSGFAWNTSALIGFRIVQGLGLGLQMSLSQAVFATVTSPRERGQYNGYLGAVIAVATVAGPVLGGFIVDLMGWRWCFWIGVPFTVIAMIVVQLKLTVPAAPKRKPRVDYLGAILVTLSVTVFMLWMSEASKKVSPATWQFWVPLVVSIAIGVGFIFWEHKAAEPIIPFDVLNSRVTKLAIAVSIVLGISQNSVGVFMGQYFQMGRGYTPTHSGLALLPIVLGSLVASTVSGFIVSARGKWKPSVTFGIGIMMLGTIMMSFCDANTPFWFIAIGLILIGSGQGASMQNLVLAVQNTVAYKDIGASTAVVTFSRSMGGTIGLQVLGAFFNRNLTDNVTAGAHTLVKQGVNAKQLTELTHVGDLSVLSSGDRVAKMVMNAYGDSINIIFICIGIVSILAFIGVLCMRSTVLRDSIDLEPSEYDSKNTAAGAAAAGAAARQSKSKSEGQSKGKNVAGVADTAERGVPLPRTADRDDLQPMDLGEVWDLGDNVRLQRVYSPGTGPKHATAEHTLGPVDA